MLKKYLFSIFGHKKTEKRFLMNCRQSSNTLNFIKKLICRLLKIQKIYMYVLFKLVKTRLSSSRLCETQKLFERLFK